MSNLKVSIIILAYNTSDVIFKTLESLMQQSFPNWEGIIVGNINSEGFFKSIVNFIEPDSRFRLVEQSQANPSIARNLGIEQARYDWLLFIDAGDWLFPEHLEKLTAPLRATPKANAVFCNWTTTAAENIRNNSYSYTISDFSELKRGLFYHLTVCNQFPLHACIIKKALVRAVGNFDPELNICQAWDLWQRIARAGICWISVDLILAGCLPQQKKVCLNPQQLLIEGLQVITRGHQIDSRVTKPHDLFAKGSPARLISNALLYWTGYCTGMAIALGRDGSSLLSYLATQKNLATSLVSFDLSILDIAIAKGILNAECTKSEEFSRFWHLAKPKIEQFFHHFNRYTGRTLKILSRIRSIEKIILEQISLDRPLALTRFYGVDIDVTQPIIDLPVPYDLETLNCRVYLAKEFLGSIDLPVFDRKISRLVLSDAIANRYGWEILRYFFEQKVYSELTIKRNESSIVVQKGKLILAEDLTPDLDLWQLHEKIGWKLFLQELWGATNWERNSSSQTSYCQTTLVNDREWSLIEVSEDFSDLKVVQSSLHVVVLVGGVAIGVITIAVETPMITAAELKREIVAQADLELVRAAVREGLLGQPLDGNFSLRDRLAKAARLKNTIEPSPQVAETILPNTGNLLNQYLASENNTFVLGYRQGQLIGTSASRWAILPRMAINELAESAVINDEPTIFCDRQIAPQHILYTPDFIVPQNFKQRSNQRSNSNCHSDSSSYTDRLPILMYHRVALAESSIPNRWRLSPQLFERQLRYLQEEGFYSVTLEQWRRSMLTRQPLPGNAVIITFDDGYLDFYEYASPLLKKYGFSAIVFLIVDLIGKKHEDCYLMGWQQIEQLQAEGIEFGSHSLNHPSFTNISYIDLVRQAASSKAILTRKLGVSIDALAYPYGHCNSVIEHLTGSCGYTFGLRTGFKRSTWDDSLLGLSRIEVASSDDLPQFRSKLQRQTD